MSAVVDTRLLDALVGFVNDIKPYHTKLQGFMTELAFNDNAIIRAVDSISTTIYHTSNLEYTLPGLEQLSFISEGIASNQILRLPPIVLPRFSLNASPYQTPVGHDPAVNDLTDAEMNGIPDVEFEDDASLDKEHTFSRQNGNQTIAAGIEIQASSITAEDTVLTANKLRGTITIALEVDVSLYEILGIALSNIQVWHNGKIVGYSDLSSGIGSISFLYECVPSSLLFNAPGSTFVFTYDQELQAWASIKPLQLVALEHTGRYATPFHHGAQVIVDGNLKILGEEYVVSKNRGYIQFLKDHHPTPAASVRFNFFNADRLFLTMTRPFESSSVMFLTGYDDPPFDDTSYDELFDLYTLIVDSSVLGYSFDKSKFDKKAVIENIVIATDVPIGTKFELVAVGPFKLAVFELYPGEVESNFLGFAILNNSFDTEHLSFIIRPVWLDYYFTNDAYSYVAYELPFYGCAEYDTTVEATDFFPSIYIRTEHGVIVDPISPMHKPVEFWVDDARVGVIQQQDVETTIGTSVHKAPVYIFKFDKIPPKGTYIQAKVEHSTQLSPRVEALINEQLSIVVVDSTTGLETFQFR